MAKESVSGKTAIFTFTDEVISVETSGKISYYRTDEKHSVTDILDIAGKVKATIEYDEYGVLTNPEVVKTSGNIFAYTGHVYEESTGLYYAKARYYDAEIGRFVSEDSYRSAQKDTSSNLYSYVNNNPIKYTDSSGNIAIADDAVIALVCVVGGVCYYIYVTGRYLRTPNGREALENVKEVIYNGRRYLAKEFTKLVIWVVDGVKSIGKEVDKTVTDFINWVKKKTGKTNKYIPKKGDWRALGKKKGEWLKENGYKEKQKPSGNKNGAGKSSSEVVDKSGNKIGRIDKNYKVDGKYVPEHVHLYKDSTNIHYYFND